MCLCSWLSLHDLHIMIYRRNAPQNTQSWPKWSQTLSWFLTLHIWSCCSCPTPASWAAPAPPALCPPLVQQRMKESTHSVGWLPVRLHEYKAPRRGPDLHGHDSVITRHLPLMGRWLRASAHAFTRIQHTPGPSHQWTQPDTPLSCLIKRL